MHAERERTPQWKSVGTKDRAHGTPLLGNVSLVRRIKPELGEDSRRSELSIPVQTLQTPIKRSRGRREAAECGIVKDACCS